MATLKELRTRIGSISSIERVTHALQLVAASHLRRAQQAIESARPYAVHLESVLEQLRESELGGQHHMLTDRPVERVLLVALTGDRGLCGGFNSALCRRVTAEIDRLQAVDEITMEVDLVTIGRKARDYFRSRGPQPFEEHVGVFRKSPSFDQAAKVGSAATERFASRQVDLVLLIYSEFRSVASQVPSVHQLLPVPPMPESEGAATCTRASSSRRPPSCSTTSCPATSGSRSGAPFWSRTPRSRPPA